MQGSARVSSLRPGIQTRSARGSTGRVTGVTIRGDAGQVMQGLAGKAWGLGLYSRGSHLRVKQKGGVIRFTLIKMILDVEGELECRMVGQH